MKQQIYSLFHLIVQCIRYFFHKKVFLFCEPYHSNLGDQAQLMCTEKWLRDNFPHRKLVKVGDLFTPFDCNMKRRLLNIEVWKIIVLKIFVCRKDLFIGHSGYFFIDHHAGWFTYKVILQHFKNKMIILPQTVNFYAPVVIDMARQTFSNHENLTILCRDEVSYQNAQELFTGGTKLLLFPDIVTSLVGARHYGNKRDGVLFCMRNDIEAHYTSDEIHQLMMRFNGVRTDLVDTTISANVAEMRKNRDRLIWDMIENISKFEVVITDRYHGTIFSAVASTPVIVINSADHKLSSGVNWFIDEGYGDAVQYASNLDEAYEKARIILVQNERSYNNPPYFQERYWSKLKTRL